VPGNECSESKPRFASVVLDVDSTVSGIEGIDWLAARRGKDVAARMAALTDRAMRGELPLEAIYGLRLETIRPTRADVDALSRAYIDAIAPGCRECIDTLRRHGVAVVLVSGGLRNAIEPLARHLEFDDLQLHAVDIRFGERGAYAGFDERSPLTTATGKATVIASLGLARPRMMVGDGATDLATRDAVDLFAAFTGFVTRDTVVRAADRTIANFAELLSITCEPNHPQGI
jgi:phosphoserine phosphatase